MSGWRGKVRRLSDFRDPVAVWSTDPDMWKITERQASGLLSVVPVSRYQATARLTDMFAVSTKKMHCMRIILWEPAKVGKPTAPCYL